MNLPPAFVVESEFSAGQKIGPYTILCPLGSGGMGQIYLAEDAKLRRKIALKLISPQFASDPRRVSRFEQEALAASALNHPNICVIHELGITESGRHFIAMEYIQGITLRENYRTAHFNSAGVEHRYSGRHSPLQRSRVRHHPPGYQA